MLQFVIDDTFFKRNKGLRPHISASAGESKLYETSISFNLAASYSFRIQNHLNV
jgi:hypothetical protein